MSEMKTGNVKPAGRDDKVDVTVMKALGHPLRQRILQVLQGDEIASPSEVAKRIGEPLSNVSYHFKILEKCEAVELVKTKPVRGALEHFYRATMVPAIGEKEWSALPDSIKGQLTGQTLGQIIEDFTAAAGTGGFNDGRSAIARDFITLDEESYSELSSAVTALFERAAALRERSALKLAELDPEEREGQTHELTLSALLYHRA